MSGRADLFRKMFTPGCELVSPKMRHVVTVLPVGPLHLPSGSVVTGDAIGTLDFAPLSRTAPPGVYPVEASLVTVSADTSWIAAVRIVFSREPVVTWERADGGTGGTPGYRGPLGLFVDAQIVPALDAYIDAADAEWWYQPEKTSGKGWEVACFTPDDARPETCALFRTGDGEGAFLSYWGLDAAGAPALLVTTFNVLT